MRPVAHLEVAAPSGELETPASLSAIYSGAAWKAGERQSRAHDLVDPLGTQLLRARFRCYPRFTDVREDQAQKG